ncbi:LysR family transcriptional regulator, partial [Pseudomonas syringae pv. tagetis]
SRQFYFILHIQKYQTSGLREFLVLCGAFTGGVKGSDEIVVPSLY